MKKITLFILAAAAMVFAGCQDYDSDIDDINARLSNLESWQAKINNNISSLQTIVTALQNKDYVTGVVTLSDGTGYQVTFKNSGTITIKNGTNGTNGTNGIDGTNGTNGKDAITPIIGVKLYTDGFYYWTIDTGDGKGAQWLKDNNGKMIRTTGDKGDTGDTGASGETGVSGKDAVSPQVRINTDKESNNYNMWEISTDGGATWTSTGVKATGNKGATGDTGAGDIVFAQDGVNVGNKTVTFTLSDGTVLTLPLYQLMAIAPDITDDVINILDKTTELSLKLPEGLKYNDIAYIRAEAKSAFGSEIDFQTRAGGSLRLWKAQLAMPSSKNDGTCDDNAKVDLTFPDILSHDCRKVLLLITLTKRDGSEVTTSRTLQCVDKYNYSGNGTSSSPYLIYNSLQLADLASATNKGSISKDKNIKQMQDIDLRGVCGDGKGEVSDSTWIPIGNDSIFKGNFDGNSKAIKYLYIKSDSINQGLFGINGGTIKNIILSGNINTSTSYAGGIAGRNKGTISGCENWASVSCHTYAGGIAGYNEYGTIDGCSNHASVSAWGSLKSVLMYYSYSGGITSESFGGIIRDCYNTSDVTSNEYFSGGICGGSWGTNIIHCYNTGNIVACANVGGIAGEMNGCIIACYNTGFIRNHAAVSGSTYKGYSSVGGITGDISSTGSGDTAYIVGSYCRANVSGSWYVAGITGIVFLINSPGKAGITSCYYSGNTSGLAFDTDSKLTNAVGIVVMVDPGGTITSCYFTGHNYTNAYGTQTSPTNLKNGTDYTDMNNNIATWNTNHPTLKCKYLYTPDTSNTNDGYPVLAPIIEI